MIFHIGIGEDWWSKVVCVVEIVLIVRIGDCHGPEGLAMTSVVTP